MHWLTDGGEEGLPGAVWRMMVGVGANGGNFNRMDGGVIGQSI